MNHSHIEVKTSAFTQMYVLNAYGVYMMPGNVNPADVFFVDDTRIINGGGLNWGKIPAESTTPSTNDLIQEDGIATMTVDSVQARLNSPTGSVVRKYNTGDEIRYYWKWVGNGHRYIVWKEGTNYIYLAISNSEQAGVEPWATFRAPDDEAPSNDNLFDPKDLIQEDGVATFTVDSIRARLNDPNGKVVGTFNTGDKVRYYWKWIGNGHRYIVYKEGDDYILVAVSGSEEQGKDPWATFSAPEETPSEPEKPETKPDDDSEFSDNPDDDNFLENPDAENKTIESQHGLTIDNQIVNKSLMPYKCPFIMEAEYVVIHNAGSPGNPSADSLSASMRSSKKQKSWHFSVDEMKAVLNLPLNRNGWHAGDGRDGNGNRKGIAIEICRDMYDSDGTWTSTNKADKVHSGYEKARNNGALLAAILLNEYGWDISHLKKHQDFSAKYCPHHILNDGWDSFVEQVQDHLDAIQGNTKPEEPAEPSEPDNPSDEKPDNGNTDEGLDYGLLNKVLKWLLKLLKKLVGIFK